MRKQESTSWSRDMAGEQERSSLAVMATVVIVLVLLLGLAGLVAAGAFFWFVGYQVVGVQQAAFEDAIAQAVPLPDSGAAAELPPDFLELPAVAPVVIRCDRRGEIRVEGQVLTVAALREQLSGLGGETAVLLWIHPECPYRCVVEIERSCLVPAQISNYEFRMDAREAEPPLDQSERPEQNRAGLGDTDQA